MRLRRPPRPRLIQRPHFHKPHPRPVILAPQHHSASRAPRRRLPLSDLGPDADRLGRAGAGAGVRVGAREERHAVGFDERVHGEGAAAFVLASAAVACLDDERAGGEGVADEAAGAAAVDGEGGFTVGWGWV